MLYLFSNGLAPTTIKYYIVAICYTQISLGYGDPHIGKIARPEYIIKGATPPYSGQPLVCAVLASFLRLGEAVIPRDLSLDATVHLVYGMSESITRCNHPMWKYTSKTNSFWHDVSTYLGQVLCSVAAILDDMVCRGLPKV